MNGARVVQRELMEKIKDKRLSLHVVWTPVLKNDEHAAALSSQSLIPDPRATHYWDGDKVLGTVYGEAVELPNGRDFAWDIYFAFPGGVLWKDTVPIPADFAHQLGRDERHLGNGSRLRKMVQGLLKELE